MCICLQLQQLPEQPCALFASTNDVIATANVYRALHSSSVWCAVRLLTRDRATGLAAEPQQRRIAVHANFYACRVFMVRSKVRSTTRQQGLDRVTSCRAVLACSSNAWDVLYGRSPLRITPAICIKVCRRPVSTSCELSELCSRWLEEVWGVIIAG